VERLVAAAAQGARRAKGTVTGDDYGRSWARDPSTHAWCQMGRGGDGWPLALGSVEAGPSASRGWLRVIRHRSVRRVGREGMRARFLSADGVHHQPFGCSTRFSL